MSSHVLGQLLLIAIGMTLIVYAVGGCTSERFASVPRTAIERYERDYNECGQIAAEYLGDQKLHRQECMTARGYRSK